MAPNKTATLNLRINPALKEALRLAANKEHRSVANMVELLIREHCGATGVPVHEQQEIFPEGDE